MWTRHVLERRTCSYVSILTPGGKRARVMPKGGIFRKQVPAETLLASLLDDLKTMPGQRMLTDVIDFRAAESHSVGVECAVAGERDEVVGTRRLQSEARRRGPRDSHPLSTTTCHHYRRPPQLLIPSTSLSPSKLKASYQGGPLCVGTSAASLPPPGPPSRVRAPLPPSLREGP